jgi:hypothetical protein
MPNHGQKSTASPPPSAPLAAARGGSGSPRLPGLAPDRRSRGGRLRDLAARHGRGCPGTSGTTPATAAPIATPLLSGSRGPCRRRCVRPTPTLALSRRPLATLARRSWWAAPAAQGPPSPPAGRRPAPAAESGGGLEYRGTRPSRLLVDLHEPRLGAVILLRGVPERRLPAPGAWVVLDVVGRGAHDLPSRPRRARRNRSYVARDHASLPNHLVECYAGRHRYIEGRDVSEQGEGH